MLQVNPDLSPRQIKEILLQTATPLKNAESDRQGRGMINPQAALDAVKNMNSPDMESSEASTPNTAPKVIDNSALFAYKSEDKEIEQVALAGDFNGWSIKRHKMDYNPEKEWQIELFFPMRGKYHYKFVLNQKEWITDASNSWKEADGYGGYNNVFRISQSRK